MDRRAQADRFGPYFDLQLRFAGRMAAAEAISLAEAVTRHTNLHRRFGLGAPDAGRVSPIWARYLEGLHGRPTPAARVAWTQQVFVAAPEESPPAGQRSFGCFSCEPPNSEGLIRFHFANADNGPDAGPLSRSRLAFRFAELRAMFAFVRETYPSAVRVGGGSWLYNLEAYRRLFPVAFGASRALPTGAVQFAGSSSWGQFLDRHGGVKPDLARRFIDNLDALDPTEPWRAFPLPVMRANAPIELFHDFYAAGRADG